MTQRHTTRDAVLTFLAADPEPRPLVAMYRYMKMMHKVDAGAVREQLRRLVKEGVIRHPSRGFYQRSGQ